MNVKDIVNLSPNEKTKDSNLGCAYFEIHFSRDPIIKGLVSTIADELHQKRLDGQEYMGGNSPFEPFCLEDARILMSRIILDRANFKNGHLSDDPFRSQISDIAYKIFTEEGQRDEVDNWMRAQRRYVRGILEEFKQRIEAQESYVRKAEAIQRRETTLPTLSV